LTAVVGFNLGHHPARFAFAAGGVRVSTRGQDLRALSLLREQTAGTVAPIHFHCAEPSAELLAPK
jgi:hypothetical protein